MFIIYSSAHVGQPPFIINIVTQACKASRYFFIISSAQLSLLHALQNELHPVCASFAQPIHLHIHPFFVLTPLAMLRAILLDVCPFTMMDYVDILLERLIILLTFCIMVQNGNSFVLT
jgi:hypothetical protein